MIRHRYGDRGTGKAFLHHNMAATLTYFDEPVPRQNGANFLT